MKFNFSKAWCLANAELETDVTAGAGASALRPVIADEGVFHNPIAEDARVAFGRWLNLARRRGELTIEELAHGAEIAIGELINIEEYSHSLPEPRTVYQLAAFFNVSPARLLELAGLARPQDAQFIQEALRFAARSEAVSALSPEEQTALEDFATVLSEKA